MNQRQMGQQEAETQQMLGYNILSTQGCTHHSTVQPPHWKVKRANLCVNAVRLSSVPIQPG